MGLKEKFTELARLKKRKIGIAILRPIPETVSSLKNASEFADLVVVGAKIEGFENIIEENDDKASEILINLLKEEKVEGIVRGQVKDSYTLDVFFKKFNKEPIPSNRKVAAAVLQKGDYNFVVSGCSVYQGMTLEDKIYETERLIKYMRDDLGIDPKIAVMGILRPSSKHGKFEMLDDISGISEKFYEYLISKGYEAKQYYMEYETAVWDKCNLIVPSVGFVGNSWYKSLLYLGGWESLSCAYLDMGVVYEDGSRNETDYFWHIIHAVALCNKKSG
ncbi:MAG: hypothetical protein WC860_03880 [Candidatus Margulisiibacteriota bacterium]|jgi:predicted methyltransferase MtxX (methanogen marker protein 4)